MHIAMVQLPICLGAYEEVVSPDGGPGVGIARGSFLAVSFPRDRYLSVVSDHSLLPQSRML